jgi:hypothetical protein
MTEDRPRLDAACRTGAVAALAALAATVASGPGAMLLVSLTRPQPPWRDARLLAEHHHLVQVTPYFLGFFLTGSFVVLLASLFVIAGAKHKARALAGLVFGGIAASVVFHNYVLQTTFVPELVRRYDPANAPLVAAFSMVNPTSLAWGLEMWGYGFLGVGTWLSAPVFDESGLERAVSFAFVANGITSLAGALITAFDPGWVFRTTGLSLFFAWNLLVVVMLALAYVALARRARISGDLTLEPQKGS